MIQCCTVNIEYFDKKTNRVHTRNVRRNAAFSMRKINGGFEITVKSANNNDLFITEKPLIYDKFVTDGKITIKIPENRCAISIQDTVEDDIRNLLQVLSQNSPGLVRRASTVRPQVLKFGDNKENIYQDLKLNISPKPEKTYSDNKSSFRSPDSKERTTSRNNLFNKSPPPFDSSINLHSPKVSRKLTSPIPIKRRITPTKNEKEGLSSLSSPQNLRKQTKLSSPVQFSQKNSVIRNLKNEIKRNNNSSFTIEQNNIITACLNRENVFFTGGAGTGKSTLLLFIIEKLYEMYEKHTVFVTATTGLAACSIGGTTVQQFAGISVLGESNDGKIDQAEIIKCALQKQFVVRQVRQANVLVIDEISMLGPSLLETLNSILQGCRGNGRPMGGLQIILTGDFFQLPPVTKTKCFGDDNFMNIGSNSIQNINRKNSTVTSSSSSSYHPIPNTNPNSSYPSTSTSSLTKNFFNSKSVEEESISQKKSDSLIFSQLVSYSQNQKENENLKENSIQIGKKRNILYCFQSSIWKDIISSTFVLTNVFRQKEMSFSSLLNSVRCGELTDSTIRLLSECVGRKFDCSDGILPTRIYTHRKDVDDLNEEELSKLTGDIFEFKAIDSGDLVFLRMLQSHCPAKLILKLKIGAQVILVKTIDPAEGLVNGVKGVVIKFTRDTKRPVIRFTNGLERIIMNEAFSVNSGGRTMGQRTQIPLALAWGMSVHKSQGISVDKAILNLKKVFEFGQAYVALSRVRTLEGLSLEGPLSADQVKVHPAVVEFYKKLEKK